MKRFRKIFASLAAAILLFLIFLILFPFLFEDQVGEMVKKFANKNLKSELNFSDMDLSFFNHFPRLTLALKDFSLKGSAPFEKDTLVSAREISLGINVMSLFGPTIRINRVYLDRAKVTLQYNENGKSNFDVYATSDTATAEKTDTASSSGAVISIEDIIFSNCSFHYADPSIPLSLTVKGFNYNGKSMLTNDILLLTSDIKADSVDVVFDNNYLVHSKPLEAKLTTRINTSDLTLHLEKNDLKIKDMPVNFNGRFNFLKDGYSLRLRFLSIYNNEVFSASVRINSTDQLYLFARVNTILDLAKWSAALGIDQVNVRGMFNFNLEADGIYEAAEKSNDPKAPLFKSIPKFTVSSRLTGGYFKYRDLPQALKNISFDLNAKAPDHDYRHITVSLDKLRATFLGNKIDGAFKLKGLEDFPVEATLKSICNLAELRQVIPMDSLDLSGMLDIDVNIKGNYAPDKKRFPLSTVALKLRDGKIQTRYYPHPIEKINLDAAVTNSTGILNDTRISISPLSLLFEDHPFKIQGEIKNPDNVHYDMKIAGVLDLAKIYKVFAQKGMDLDGYLEADLSLRGIQSDAMTGHYERLQNKGRLVLRNIGLKSTYLPRQAIVREGVFRFDNDNIWFERFMAEYGKSDVRLDGHLSNVVNYVFADNQKLKGSFRFQSNFLLVDELIASTTPAENQTSTITSGSAVVQKASSAAEASDGVILIPPTLEVGLQATLKRILFRGLAIHDLSAVAEIRDGMVLLKGMQMELAGTQVAMDASYGSINPARAFFDFHVSAKDFDVKRAYNEVALFREMVSAAEHAEGIISLDYSLKGRIGKGMSPIFPSLEGGGILSLKKVKVMGLKMFNVISKGTEKEKLNNPDLSKVELKTTIKNNVITLEQTKIKISGFRLKFSGTTNFDGQLSMKVRIGLPPLGIFGIPLRLLGTTENPKIKYGRGSNDEQAEETEYFDEMPADLKAKLKNAKEEDLKDEGTEEH